MKSNCFSKKDYLFIGFLLSIDSQAAWAYLDPGTGTIILQGIVAGIVGGFMAIKMGWFRLKSFLPGAKSEQTPANTDSGTDSDGTNTKK